MSPSSSKRSNPQGDNSASSSFSSSSANKSGKNDALPPLFYYMEMGYWNKALERAQRHPREAKTWATLRTKTDEKKVSGAKRLALHHACFKLRSSSNSPIQDGEEDPFIEVCRFILGIVELYPEAAGQRESRHGCLPIHLASFASSAPREGDDHPLDDQSDFITGASNGAAVTKPLMKRGSTDGVVYSMDDGGNKNAGPSRPDRIQMRSVSNSSTDTFRSEYSGMTAAFAEERFTGSQTQHVNPNNYSNTSTTSLSAAQIQKGPSGSPKQTLNVKTTSATFQSHTARSIQREEMAVAVINALLDAYPKGIRVDSEGGRLPLHTACAGRATPRVITTLITAYSAAARHRNKDGFLPLHLVAHWGISHPSVVILILKAYPDATLGRNRWERTPLEEALCMAGENGRPHQAALVRALRKHPSYWTRSIETCQLSPAEHQYSNPGATTSSPAAARRNIVDVDDIADYSSDEDEQPQKLSKPVIVRKSRSTSNGHTQQVHSPASSTGVSSPRRSIASPNANLSALIYSKSWPGVMQRIASHPGEVSEVLQVRTRGGFVAGSGFYPLHYALERCPPVKVIEALVKKFPRALTSKLMPGASLPLHLACTWEAPDDVISLLVEYDPQTTKGIDELGNVPLHCACFSGASSAVMSALVRANPKSVLTRNNQGSLPEDICKRLRHENRKKVLTILSARKDMLMAKRSSKSSGSLGAIAMHAMELNEREGPPTPKAGKASRRTPQRSPETEKSEDGIEVAFDEEGKEEMMWV